MDRKIEKKKWTVKKIATIGIPAILFFLVAYALIFGDKSSKLNIELEKQTVSVVYRGEFQEFIPIMGSVEPIKTIELSSDEGGRIEHRYIESGTKVSKGDPILRFSNTNLLLTILNNEAQVNRASNELRSTRLLMEQNTLSLRNQLLTLDYDIASQKRAYDREKTLMDRDLGSKEAFENARDQYFFTIQRRDLTIAQQRQDSLFRLNQVDALEESLEGMQENLLIVKQKQDNLTLRAPIDGHLTSLNAEIGETKAAGERLGQIDVLDHFKVRAAIDEYYINRVEKGREGSFDIAGTTYRLVIDKIYLEVTDGRFQVDLIFTGEKPQGIRRGQTLHIKLELGDLEEAVLLARGGFYQKTGGQYVYVVDESGKFAIKRDIKLGRYNPQVFTVLEGLEIGEEVITSSYDSFNDIDKLILKK
ncbi:HlyD family efflux transporter periplasmic adaptor subunit [bacterium]|nr:HlyD family efflux transporter periplasmic adaptor subunit [bacterium]